MKFHKQLIMLILCISTSPIVSYCYDYGSKGPRQYNLTRDLEVLYKDSFNIIKHNSGFNHLKHMYKYPSFHSGFSLFTHPTVIACLMYSYYHMSQKSKEQNTDNQDSKENNLES